MNSSAGTTATTTAAAPTESASEPGVDPAGPPTVESTLEDSLRVAETKGLAQKSGLLKLLLKLRRERLSPMGLTMLAVFALVFFVATISLFIQMHYLAWLLFFLILIPTFAPKPAVELRREIPTRSSAGSTLDYTVTVRSESRRHQLDLVIHEIALPEPVRAAPAIDLRGAGADDFEADQTPAARLIPCLRPGETVEVPMALEFPRRGFYRLDQLRAETLFPFGLWRRGQFARDCVDDVLIYPKFTPLEHLELPTSRRYQPGGISLTSNVGESPELLGVRDYRDGDNPRDIDWRSWARTGEPAVKEYHEEYFCRVALIVDTQLPGKRAEDEQTYEAGISIAAAVADTLARQETIIDLFAAGPNLYRLQAGRNLAFLENILEVLACLEATTDYPFQLIVPELMEEISRIASVVFVLLDWDEHRARFVQAVIEAGVAVKIVIVRDRPPTRDPFEAEAISGRPVVTLSRADVEKGPTIL